VKIVTSSGTAPQSTGTAQPSPGVQDPVQRGQPRGAHPTRSSIASARRIVRPVTWPGHVPHGRPLPHRSTASRTDMPSLSIITSSASPAPLSVTNGSVAFTERGQHGDRQALNPTVSVGAFFAPYGLVSRRPRRLPQ